MEIRSGEDFETFGTGGSGEVFIEGDKRGSGTIADVSQNFIGPCVDLPEAARERSSQPWGAAA